MTADAPRAGTGVPELILALLRHAPRQVLSGAELAAAARARGVARDPLDDGLRALAAEGRAVVLDHPPPDPHLRGLDLRTVCAVADPSPAALDHARRTAEERWTAFLRAFLAAHRCG